MNGDLEVKCLSFEFSTQILQLAPLSVESVQYGSEEVDAICYIAFCINNIPSSSDIIDGSFTRDSEG